MKWWLQDNDIDNNIEMYLTNNKGKDVAAKRFFRTLKSKIYKYMTSISMNVNIDDIVNKYNNINYSTIKMKPVGIKSNTYHNISTKIIS